jgi:hypothetical protein
MNEAPDKGVSLWWKPGSAGWSEVASVLTQAFPDMSFSIYAESGGWLYTRRSRSQMNYIEQVEVEIDEYLRAIQGSVFDYDFRHPEELQLRKDQIVSLGRVPLWRRFVNWMKGY